jgi:gliding motility-associated-like protein
MLARKLSILFMLLVPAVLSAANYYWVGGSGPWHDINHWATSSGGTVKHSVVPSPADDVIFDQNSFSATGQTVSLPGGLATCRDFRVINLTHNVALNATAGSILKVYGSMKLNRKMSFPACPLYFEATTAGHHIDLDSINLANNVIFDGIGGTWYLDGFFSGTAIEVQFQNGSLYTQGHDLKLRSFISSGSTQRLLNFNQSEINLVSTASFGSNNLNLSALASIFRLSANNAYFQITGANPLSFNDLQFTGNGGTMNTTSSSFHDILFKGQASITGTFNYHLLELEKDAVIAGSFSGNILALTKDMDYELNSATNLTILDSIRGQATCFTYIDIFSVGIATITKNGSPLTISYFSLQNIHAGGNATHTANNSLDLGGNTGWIINAPPLATHYWVGGQGEWNDSSHWSYSSGGPPGACVPTPNDNVIFDQNSCGPGDTIFMKEPLQFCKDMTWVNLGSDTPVYYAINVSQLFIYGSLTFHPAMKLKFDGYLNFKATSPGKTISTANHLIDGPVLFDGQGGGWTLQDSLKVDNSISLKNGHVNTNSNYVRCESWMSTWTNPRTITLGSSIIDLMNDGTCWSFTTPNLSISPGSSHIRVNGKNASFRMLGGSTQNYYNITFTDTFSQGQMEMKAGQMHRLSFMGDGFATAAGYLIDSLIFMPGKAYQLEQGSLFQINQALVAPGTCSAPIIIHSDSAGYKAQIQKNTGTVSVNRVYLQDIEGFGGANFLASNSVDLGNNPGWLISPYNGIDLYWVGGSGNWSDSMHWSYTSGGPGGACIPSPKDNVFFDYNSNSIDGVVEVDVKEAHCHNMTWDQLSDTLGFAGEESKSVHIHGSLVFDSLTNNVTQAPFYFESGHAGNIIRSEGQIFRGYVEFRNRQGAWTLKDSLSTMPYVITTLTSGNLSTEGHTVRTGIFRSFKSNLRTLDIRSSDIYVQSMWLMKGDSLSFTADSSHIILLGNGSTFNNTRGTFPYWHVSAELASTLNQDSSLVSIRRAELKGDAILNNSHHFDTLIFYQGRQYKLSPADTQYLGDLIAQGSCGMAIDISCTVPGQNSYFHKVNDSIKTKSLVLKDNHAIGGAFFLAESSISKGNTNGWNISVSPPRDLYWVNGTGKWTDPYHWSLSSGGPGGECFPTATDNVFFDINSFFTGSDTVSVDTTLAECRNMTWIAIADTPVFNTTAGGELRIAGSLLFNVTMKQLYIGIIRFNGSIPGLTISSMNHPFMESVMFDGMGGWVLQDSLILQSGVLYLLRGSLNTNGKSVITNAFESTGSLLRSLTLGNSMVSGLSVWRANSPNLTLNAGSSTIVMTASGASMLNMGSGNLSYNKVLFDSEIGSAQLRSITVEPRFTYLGFKGNATILGQHESDTLLFSPGMEYRLENSKNQRVNNLLWCRGNNCFRIALRSTVTGTQAGIQSNGSINGDFINIRDINAFGGASFFAGANSTDVSNNNGWIFANSPGYIFGLGNDTTITIGDTITLQTTNFNGGANTTYLWSNGSNGSTLQVTYPGIYSITVTYAGSCTVIDTIIIGCYTPLSFSIQSTSCPGSSDGSILVIPLDTAATYTYLWSNGDTTAFTGNLYSGHYWVTATGSNGCFGIDTAFVPEPPPIILPLEDTAYCRGDSLWAFAGTGFAQYAWSSGSTGAGIYISQPGSFWALVIDNKGCISDTFHFDVREDTLPIFDLGRDEELCMGESKLLEAATGYTSYRWQDGSSLSSLLAQNAGHFWVDVQNGTCVQRDSILLLDCPPIIDVPNVFTPNGDGYNDYFGPQGQNIYRYELSIFNRWGNLIYRSEDFNAQWDGKVRGEECLEGVYFFTVRFSEYGALGRQGVHSLSGTLSLLR